MTYGERAVDVFYVKDVFGHKIVDETKLERIRKALIEVLSANGEETPKPRNKRAEAAE